MHVDRHASLVERSERMLITKKEQQTKRPQSQKQIAIKVRQGSYRIYIVANQWQHT